MHHTPKKVACIGCISLTKVASRLQRMIFRLQKLRFAYKYLVVRLQNCVSGYKTASRFSIESYKLYSEIIAKYVSPMHVNVGILEEGGQTIVFYEGSGTDLESGQEEEIRSFLYNSSIGNSEKEG